jgi:LysR family hydrogen peroxide-inducible transcriptional activator
LTTKAGDVLLARMRAVLQASRDLSTTAEGLGNPLAGTRRFGILPTVAPYVLPDLSPALRAAFPGLRLSWREEKTATLLDAVLAGELDAALVAEDEAPRGLSLVPLARDPFVLALPPHHPLTKRKRVTLADLAATEMLLLEDGHCIRTQVLALCSRAGATEASFRATSLPTLTQLVAGGFGATLLPTLSLATENRRGELLLRSFTSPAPARTLALVYRTASGNHEGLATIAEAMRPVLVALTGRPAATEALAL